MKVVDDIRDDLEEIEVSLDEKRNGTDETQDRLHSKSAAELGILALWAMRDLRWDVLSCIRSHFFRKHVVRYGSIHNGPVESIYGKIDDEIMGQAQGVDRVIGIVDALQDPGNLHDFTHIAERVADKVFDGIDEPRFFDLVLNIALVSEMADLPLATGAAHFVLEKHCQSAHEEIAMQSRDLRLITHIRSALN